MCVGNTSVRVPASASRRAWPRRDPEALDGLCRRRARPAASTGAATSRKCVSKRLGSRSGVIQCAKGTIRSVASDQVLGAHEIEEGRIAREQRRAIGLDQAGASPPHPAGPRAPPPGEHQARLLEGLARGRHHEGALRRRGGVGRQIGPARRRHPPASTLPPGNTSAPEAKSISWWRTTMNTSSPSRPSRRITTVAAGRGGPIGVLVSLIRALPCAAGGHRPISSAQCDWLSRAGACSVTPPSTTSVWPVM